MKESGVPEDVLKVLKKQVAKEMRLLKKHMDADGWDLNFEFIKSECIAPIISNWFEWYLIAKINEKGYGLKFSKNKHTDESVFVITKKGND